MVGWCLGGHLLVLKNVCCGSSALLEISEWVVEWYCE
jgi:hypothetical protein